MPALPKHTIRYCPGCGSGDLLHSVPAGDSLPRYQCPACGYVHYFNPVPVVGAILTWQEKILLCKRSIEPRKGLWTYPAGFMELNESIQAGTERECMEEANAVCERLSLFALFTLRREGQVHIVYRGRLGGGRARAGAESLETALFEPGEIPFDELAFPVIKECIRLYLEDLDRGSFVLHQGSICSERDGSWRTEYNETASR